ncbi:biotin biosynthesis protein BioC [Salmonella enterica subsp. enterica]|uniref:Biotin biosynthesis protein BioC n=1 Tax=Salmonella enterica I TaxID=59201 RepID=A0A3S4I268_SALET|nr:biotin biosynthesis protein BioC [Salmonella enterica subsp. enterica]
MAGPHRNTNSTPLLQQHSADALLTLLTGRQFASVLDAGCGPGRNESLLARAGSEVTALDLSLPMLQQARDRQAAHHYLAGGYRSDSP